MSERLTLLPCPFCGSTWGEGLTLGYRGQPAVGFFIHCTKCQADGPYSDGHQDSLPAFLKWNERPALSSLSEGPPSVAGDSVRVPKDE